MVARTDTEDVWASVARAARAVRVGMEAELVAHDLGNLITAIHGLAELIGAGAAEPGDIEEIRRAALLASTLVQRIRAAGQETPEPRAATDLSGAAALVVGVLRPTIDPRVDVALRLAPEVLTVRARPGHLEQLVLNLAVNACEAMPGGGRLEIETRSSRGSAVLSLSDTGPGMDGSALSRAFERGFSTKGGRRSRGLGLALVAEVVRDCGGSLRVTSHPGRGTHIEVRFPTDPCCEESDEAAEAHVARREDDEQS